MYYASDSTLVLVHDDGSADTVAVDRDSELIVVHDDKGHEYVADKGAITQTDDVASAQNSADKGGSQGASEGKLSLISFLKDDLTNYGFDEQRLESMKQAYDKISVIKQDYYVPYKAVEAGAMEYLRAKPSFSPSLGKVNFQLASGAQGLITTPADNGYRLTMSGATAGGTEDMLAELTLQGTTAGKSQKRDSTVLLGQCKLVAYPAKNFTMYLIPVGEAASYDKQGIATQVVKIYQQAVLKWQVQWLPQFAATDWDVDGSNVFTNTDNDNRMNYTPSMRALIKAFRKGQR
jgi:hypothetical protein